MAILTVMFAGPADVQDERRVFNAAVDSCNRLLRIADTESALLPLHWSTHALPGLVLGASASGATPIRPQDEINYQLVDQASALVAVFAERFGSSTGITASGTQEEIERARSRSIPCIVCFRDAHVRPSDLLQAHQVATYRRALQDLMLTCSYTTAEDLQLRLVEWLFAMATTNLPSRSDARRQAELHALLAINEILSALQVRQLAGIFYTIAGSKSDALVGIHVYETFSAFCCAYRWTIERLPDDDIAEMVRDSALGCLWNRIDLDDDRPLRMYAMRPYVRTLSVSPEFEERLSVVYSEARRRP